VITLLVIALIPTTIHSYIGASEYDGKSIHAIPDTFNDFRSTPSKRYAQWGQEIFDAEDWFERDYFDNTQTQVRLFIAQSYNHKRLYHHPELGASYGQNLAHKTILTMPGASKIPVHILTNDDRSKLIAYVLLYDNEFIKDPIMHQLIDSTRLLVSARKQMTLFYASQPMQTDNTEFEKSATAALLLSAIQSFQSQ